MNISDPCLLRKQIKLKKKLIFQREKQPLTNTVALSRALYLFLRHFCERNEGEGEAEKVQKRTVARESFFLSAAEILSHGGIFSNAVENFKSHTHLFKKNTMLRVITLLSLRIPSCK